MSEEIRRRCAEAGELGTGPVSDAMEGMKLRRSVIIGMQFVSQDPTSCLVGPAFTLRQVQKARSVPHDENRARHPEAVTKLAQAGDVVVVDNGGRTDIAVFGENLAMKAVDRGIAGFVVNGSVRDREWMRKIGFTVVSRGTSPVSSKWELETVAMNEPVVIDGVMIRPGDVIYADADGIIVLAKEHCLAVLDRAAEIKRDEEKTRAALYSD
jgi:regulator of RNase E activity RraA